MRPSEHHFASHRYPCRHADYKMLYNRTIDPDFDELEIDWADYSDYNNAVRVARVEHLVRPMEAKLEAQWDRLRRVHDRFRVLANNLHIARRHEEYRIRHELEQLKESRRQLISRWAEELLCE